MPFVRQVVTSVTEEDGRGGTATTAFTYRGGRYDAKERKFLGFAGLTATRSCNAGETACPVTDISFRQDLAAVGAVSRIEERNGAGTVLRVRTEEYTANNTVVPFTALNLASVEENRDGGVTRSRRTERSFNAFGEEATVATLGATDVTGDERVSVTTRYPNLTAYIVDRPAEQTVYAGSASGTMLARTRTLYDGASGETTPPVKGDPTTTLHWLNSGGSEVSRSAGYDSYGNAVSVTDPAGAVTSTVYDATHHLFPVETTNALGQVTSQTIHPTCGLPATTTDVNGLVSSVTYDAHCRETRRDLPGGDYVATAYLSLGSPANQNIESAAPRAMASSGRAPISTASAAPTGRRIAVRRRPPSRRRRPMPSVARSPRRHCRPMPAVRSTPPMRSIASSR